MGSLYKSSWHSKHAGQTVDDAVDRVAELVEEINNMYERLNIMQAELDSQRALLNNKYGKTGGPITVNDSARIVTINGGADNLSALKVKYIDGITTTSNNQGLLYLNKNSTGDIILGKGGAKVDNKGKVHGAIWNDFAEYRESEVTEPGRVICENGDGTLSLSHKRLQPGATVISDTFGFAIGETDKAKTPIAVAGRVLAHTYEDWWTFEPGEAVCTGPDGTVSKMSRREIRKYPERIIGIVSELPTYETWGDNKIPVDGRIWINIK